MTDEEGAQSRAMLREMMGGKKLVLATDDDTTGRLLFGDDWAKVKAGMEPGSQYELSLDALPPPGHGLAAVVIAGTSITFACVCGALLGPKAGQTWDVDDNGDGTVKLTPSVDVEGHFHDVYDRVPQAKSMTEATQIARAARDALGKKG